MFPCNCCKNFHSNLHGYCNAHRFSRFHHKFFSRCHLVPTAAETIMGRSSFWAQKLDPIRNGSSMFLLMVIRSKSGSRDENHPAVERVSLVQVGRFSLIYVGFDEHPTSQVITTQDFFFTINCTRTLSSVGQQHMSSMWHHGISMGITCHAGSCWRCHYHPLPV